MPKSFVKFIAALPPLRTGKAPVGAVTLAELAGGRVTGGGWLAMESLLTGRLLAG